MHENDMKVIDNAKNGNKDAMTKLIEDNNGLIWSIVRRFNGRGYDIEDLYQIGTIGFIKAMNCKFYGGNNEDTQEDFTWCRWFFPNIMVDTSLMEIDKYMQEYIRYIITGRHYKGNYRITYEQMKEWGYRSLVHEYYMLRSRDRFPIVIGRYK